MHEGIMEQEGNIGLMSSEDLARALAGADEQGEAQETVDLSELADNLEFVSRRTEESAPARAFHIASQLAATRVAN